MPISSFTGHAWSAVLAPAAGSSATGSAEGAVLGAWVVADDNDTQVFVIT